MSEKTNKSPFFVIQSNSTIKMKTLYAIIACCLLISYTTFSQSISSNAPLCGNANLTLELTATGGTTYSWKGPNSFTSTQQKPSIKNVNYRNRGVYTVTIDNKTTLATDVNIKDPVTFTVPKEISVCEGGTLIIEPKSGRLTDSTEMADFFVTVNNIKDQENSNGIFKNIALKEIGKYEVFGYNYSKGCTTSKFVDVKLNTSKDCKSISVEDITKIKMCYGQEVVVPFTIKGNFKVGTKFKAYVYVFNFNRLTSNSLDNSIAIVEKSPFVIKNLDKYLDQTIAIVIVADDAEKTTAISDYKYFNSNYFYRNNTVNSSRTCDSSKLSVGYPNNINSLQWYLDGNSISGATKSNFTAKKTDTYSFKFKGNDNSNEIDKTCLYESQLVKIELGKIEKPSVQDTSRTELCVGNPTTLFVNFPQGNTSYRWKKDGNYIVNATNSSYQTLQEGKYQVEAKEGNCTVFSDTIMIKKPTSFDNYLFRLNVPTTIQLNEQEVYTICDNQEFSFYTIRVPSMARHQLFKNGTLINEAPNQNKFNSNTLKGEGIYFLNVSYGQWGVGQVCKVG